MSVREAPSGPLHDNDDVNGYNDGSSSHASTSWLELEACILSGKLVQASLTGPALPGSSQRGKLD